MTNSKNVLKCRSLSNCGTNKTVVGNYWLLWGNYVREGTLCRGEGGSSWHFTTLYVF